MTQGSKIITYWAVGIVGVVVVLVVLAYLAGWFDPAGWFEPAATGAS